MFLTHNKTKQCISTRDNQVYSRKKLRYGQSVESLETTHTPNKGKEKTTRSSCACYNNIIIIINNNIIIIIIIIIITNFFLVSK